ncbi:MAG: hypothetical protein ACT4PE_13700 [Candidatus Eiseniibacteriota bacterium]
MTYRVVVKPAFGGGWHARCEGAPLGPAESHASTEDEAVLRVRNEIRYRLEMCPCSGVSEEFVELTVERRPGPRGNAWRP